MKPNRTFLGTVIVITVISVTLTGCYTLLKHPRVTDYSDDTEYANCAQCHGQFIHPSPFDRYYYAGIWSDYYYFPWWYEHVWDSYYDINPAPRREIIRRNTSRTSSFSNPAQSMGTTRAKVITPSTTGRDAFKYEETESKKIRSKSIKNENRNVNKRNIIKSRTVKESKSKKAKKK